LPTVWIPTPLRDLTHGRSSVAVTGATVREAIEDLESRFPGVKERLCEGDKVRPNISVFVDGQITHLKMREYLDETSEVHFLIAISGGSPVVNHHRPVGTN
jgi:sulfur-carrier protein